MLTREARLEALLTEAREYVAREALREVDMNTVRRDDQQRTHEQEFLKRIDAALAPEHPAAVVDSVPFPNRPRDPVGRVDYHGRGCREAAGAFRTRGGEVWGPTAKVLDAMGVDLRAAAAELDHMQTGYARELNSIEQAVGKALDYPWFKDDLKNFPDATLEDGVCIGAHTAGSIVDELIGRLSDALLLLHQVDRRELALILHAPFSHDYIKDEKVCPKCRFLQDLADFRQRHNHLLSLRLTAARKRA